MPRAPRIVPVGSARRTVRGLVLVLVTALTLVPAGVALAHAVIAPGDAPAGTPVDFTLTIPHGCTDGEPPPDPGDEVSPTTEVAVRLPADTRDVTAEPPAGWEVGVTTDDERMILTYAGGQFPPDEAGTFAFTATLHGAEGDRLAFEVFQGCADGEYRWVETDEDPDGEPLDQPAPLVTLTSTATAPPEPTPTPTLPTTEATDGTPSPAPGPTPTAEETPTTVGTASPTPAPTTSPTAPVTETTGGAGENTGGFPTRAAAAIVIAAGLAGVVLAVLRSRSG